MRPTKILFAICLAICLAGLARLPAHAGEDRRVPTLDTEDGSLGMTEAGQGRWHPMLGADLRNGDFSRGNYDDDGVDLDPVPFHAQFSLAYEMTRDASGAATSWFFLRSSNGFHDPALEGEDEAPRSWYESNNIAGFVAPLAPGLSGALSYTLKMSPNGVSDSTQEIGTALAYEGKDNIGALNPGIAATWRAAGPGGVYTQAAIEPGWDLGAADPLRLSLPATLGIGWNGFYETGSGTRGFASAGVALSKPLRIAGRRVSLRADMLAIARDGRLRDLDGDGATDRKAVVPYVMLSLSYAY
jgi:hypothetical protein